MEKRSIFVLLGLLVAVGALAETYYKWTDEEGVIHYSDLPHPGAVAVELGDSNKRRPRPTTRRSATTLPAADEEPAATMFTGYDSLEFLSPTAEETLWNIEGTLSVSLQVIPALKPGHQVRVYFDGTPQTVSGPSFQLQEVHRGVHNLQAEVIDQTGKLMIRSRPNRFYVQQNSVL